MQDYTVGIMKLWLRVILILASVGGGFTGAVMTLDIFLHSAHGVVNHIFVTVFLALFIFVTASGVLFSLDYRRARLLLISLAIQIPWISTPVIVYKFATGIYAALTLGNVAGTGRIGIRFWTEMRLGSTFRFSWWSDVNPWGIGINWVALLLFLLLWRFMRGSTSRKQHESHAENLQISA